MQVRDQVDANLGSSCTCPGIIISVDIFLPKGKKEESRSLLERSRRRIRKRKIPELNYQYI